MSIAPGQASAQLYLRLASEKVNTISNEGKNAPTILDSLFEPWTSYLKVASEDALAFILISWQVMDW